MIWVTGYHGKSFCDLFVYVVLFHTLLLSTTVSTEFVNLPLYPLLFLAKDRWWWSPQQTCQLRERWHRIGSTRHFIGNVSNKSSNWIVKLVFFLLVFAKDIGPFPHRLELQSKRWPIVCSLMGNISFRLRRMWARRGQIKSGLWGMNRNMWHMSLIYTITVQI